MALFTKTSLEALRQRIDLVEVLSSHIDLRRAGSCYKALCPFHEERTPSFTLQRGDTHYHCFGCGAHGDAITFLMEYAKLSFLEAVENLAERFHIALERQEQGAASGPGHGKAVMKQACEQAATFYHFYLLHTEEGQSVLPYLFARGLDLEFIRTFRIGLAPKAGGLLLRYLRSFSRDVLLEAGLMAKSGDNREFFSERILFPICDPLGSVIGFSARKYRDTTFGGKYINSPETLLFKKSHVLFGLHHCRKRMAKEKKALIVEGQIDALRLIQEGLDFCVSSLGTAFGEGHVRQLLQLGVNCVYIAFDGDRAGQQAAVKTGHLLQKEGVEVFVVPLPPLEDPDSLLSARGVEGFSQLLERKTPYLAFLLEYESAGLDLQSPAAKTQLAQSVAKRIRSWDHPLMVHESLRLLARMLQVPQEMLGFAPVLAANSFHQKSALSRQAVTAIDPHLILETDLLRWLFLMGSDDEYLHRMVAQNIEKRHFLVKSCRDLFCVYMQSYEQKQPLDLLSLAMHLDEGLQKLLSEILERKVKRERAREHLAQAIQKVLDRDWMLQGEDIKGKILRGQLPDEEALAYAKELAELKRHPPKMRLP